MFQGCISLSSLDLSKLDTSQVTGMGWMFTGCSALSSLDVSGWDTSRVTDMDGMFYGCSALSSLDVSGWDTSRVTDMDGMFYGCSALSSLDVSGWDTSRVTDMELMFYDCSSLSSLDLSGWDTSRVTKMGSMFSGCRSLASLDLSSFDTSQVTDMGGMFGNCRSLASLDVSGFDTSRGTDMAGMFDGCPALSSITVGKGAGRMLSVEASGFPAGRDGRGWFSARDRRWFTAEELSPGRQGIADTYTTYGPGDEPKPEGRDVSKASVDAIPDQAWTGSAVEPRPTVRLGGRTLSEGTDYALSFRDNTDAGTATLTVTGRGSYTGAKSVTFRIVRKDEPKPGERDVSKASVDAIPDQAWTGSAVEPRPTVRLGGRTLSEGTDYALSFRDNTDPGTATVTIEGRGSYTGAKSVTFRIVRRDEPKPDPGKPKPDPDKPDPEGRDVSRASVDAIPDQTFTGSPLEPRPTVRLGGRTLSEGTDYELSFGGNEGIGTATVTVAGKGAYTGAKSVTFRIGFSDVPAGHWALTGDVGGESYLAAVVRMGLMTGYGDPATGRLTGRFGPEDGVTRAQVVTVLYRRANPGSTDTTTGAHADNATSLSDNESGRYYTAAVNWAVRTGVVTGYTAGPDAGRFVPDREISREELATMVHRFAALEGADDSVPDSAYGGAPDAGDVSGWASGHVAWCYAHQVLTGHADTGLLEPQGTATRAQMAKMAVQTIKAMGR